MSKRAVLHIGFEKTGTTSTLATLLRSRADLAAAGILVPEVGADHTFLAAAFGRQSRAVDGREADLAALARQVEAFDGGDILFSAESLAAMQPAGVSALAEHLSSIVTDVLVVAYVRHPVEQAASLSQQLVKSGHARLAEVDAAPRYRRYRPRLEKYVEAFGRDQVLVVPFERAALAGGAVQRDLLTRMGRADAQDALTLEDRNESLTTPAVVLKSLMDQADPSLRVRRKPLSRIAGPKFALTEEALAAAEALGADDLLYLEAAFGMRLSDPSRRTREPLSTMFTKEVMRSIRRYGRRLEGAYRTAFAAALEAIEDGDYHGARFVEGGAAPPTRRRATKGRGILGLLRTR
ncbi:hypothetical protein [Acuticoccus sp.]|uniref:hypothetical protein n=1 Tax=Acuticoccus sp. TaxID=1904378 RepID=UPI003B523DAB